MLVMTPQLFKDFLFDYFIEWEKQQPKKRSSYSAFSRWLSDNSYKTVIKQQLVSDWINGRYKPEDEKYLLVLAEKIGNEIYEVLGVEPPNPYLQKINSLFQYLSPKHQQQLADEAERYEAENHAKDRATASKQRKTTKN